MWKKIFVVWVIAVIALNNLVSCTKQNDWLDKKLNLSDVVPTTLDDFDKIMDAETILNAQMPGLGTVASDNHYLLTADWAASTINERNTYIWKSDVFEGGSVTDWNAAYRQIEYSNVVLDGIARINPTIENRQLYDRLKGAALFHRSLAFYNLCLIFSKAYSPTAKIDLGIPLKITSDVNEKLRRSTVEESYQEIVRSLLSATELLPSVPALRTRPSKSAAFSLLARVYLDMGNYSAALTYSSKSLDLDSYLYDFNSLSQTASYPFTPFVSGGNKEVIFYATQVSYASARANNKAFVDTTLYASYSDDDLRKQIFFRVVSVPLKRFLFKGTYTGSTILFGGLSTNENYLISAECNARLGNLTNASENINALLEKRWRTNKYIRLNFTNQDSAITRILMERRKELPFSGRWADLRRLNVDSKYQISLTRSVDGNTYSLPPGDNRYVFPIPEQEILFNGFEQNKR